MAVFSVYDYDRRQFDYYETPTDVTHQALGSVKFSTFRALRKMSGATKIGLIPEAAAFPLPPGAKKIGSGSMPQGVIACSSLGGSLLNGALAGVSVTPEKIGIGLLATFLAWKVVKKLFKGK
jgi:hypothetical protein